MSGERDGEPIAQIAEGLALRIEHLDAHGVEPLVLPVACEHQRITHPHMLDARDAIHIARSLDILGDGKLPRKLVERGFEKLLVGLNLRGVIEAARKDVRRRARAWR